MTIGLISLSGALILIIFTILSFVMLYAYTGKITPPEKALNSANLPKLEVTGYLGLIYHVFFMVFDSLGTLTYSEPLIGAPGTSAKDKEDVWSNYRNKWVDRRKICLSIFF